ncbi:MAG: LexA family protein [Candidatus Kapaibacterium sp.]
MSSKEEYQKLAAVMSDGELFEEYKKYLIREELGDRCCSWRVEVLGREAALRNSGIMTNAMHDALAMASSIRLARRGLRVTNIIRLDHMDSSKLDAMLQTIGAARRHDIVAEEERSVTSIFDLFGIERENLLICWVSGESMTGANINEGDRLLVDTAAPPRDGSIIVAKIDGSIFVKRLRIKAEETWLHSENEKFAPVRLDPDRDFEVLGVVRHVLHSTL